MLEYRWALPAALLGDAPGGRTSGRVRRSTRDWAVDIVMFLVASVLTLVIMMEMDGRPRPVMLAEQVLGATSCAAVWLRRRWPAGFALVLAPLSAVFEGVAGAGMVSVFTLAVHRPFRVVAPIAAMHALALLPFSALYPEPELDFWGTFVFGVTVSFGVVAWGMLVRARRQLVISLRERAVRAEVEAELREERARHLERERIAREMHDVLAHRISLLSLHAGALEFRPGAPSAEIARAAGAIRGSAHQALQDLRQVIGVLRHGDEDGAPERPQPTLADLPGLIEESRRAGMPVSFDMSAEGEVPEVLGRNVYRIVQEALTNARKHAQGQPVEVRVAGGAGEGLTAEVRNRVPGRRSDSRMQGFVRDQGPVVEIPGTGTGLIGMAERAELAGGRLEHGLGPGGDFTLKAWLPWPA
ncbi:sensor histidine kinase [Sinosporangium siamense]|nr:histidine kinase [Sinosporangium siamense]